MSILRSTPHILALALAAFTAARAAAEDWGAYAIVPVSAQIGLWTYNASNPHLQWYIKPLAGTGVTAPAANGPPVYEPPEIKPEGILPGSTKQFTFTQSKVFPGSVREVTVFIPGQYDDQKPACAGDSDPRRRLATGGRGFPEHARAGRTASPWAQMAGYMPSRKSPAG